ncbi:hypothetical protein XVE_4948, partial [Xanthomonas vesicatoria ATCC 35937]
GVATQRSGQVGDARHPGQAGRFRQRNPLRARADLRRAGPRRGHLQHAGSAVTWWRQQHRIEQGGQQRLGG